MDEFLTASEEFYRPCEIATLFLRIGLNPFPFYCSFIRICEYTPRVDSPAAAVATTYCLCLVG